MIISGLLAAITSLDTKLFKQFTRKYERDPSYKETIYYALDLNRPKTVEFIRDNNGPFYYDYITRKKIQINEPLDERELHTLLTFNTENSLFPVNVLEEAYKNKDLSLMQKIISQIPISKRNISLHETNPEDEAFQLLVKSGFTFNWCYLLGNIEIINTDKIVPWMIKSYSPQELKIILDDYYNCSNVDYNVFLSFILKLGLDPEDIFGYIQGPFPKPIYEELPTYSSGRARLPINQVRAFGLREMPTNMIDKEKLLTNFIHNESCFCLISPQTGFLEDRFLPVIRYGKNPFHGYYGGVYEFSDAEFTWYYLEPQSGIYLYCPKLYLSKNKYTVLTELYQKALKEKYSAELEFFFDETKALLSLYNDSILDILRDEIELKVLEEEKDMELDISDIVPKLLSKERIMLPGGVDNYFFEIDTSELRFGGNFFDTLDIKLWEYGRLFDLDVLVFTHQPGTNRLVSECLDTRMRTESYDNLYKLE